MEVGNENKKLFDLEKLNYSAVVTSVERTLSLLD